MLPRCHYFFATISNSPAYYPLCLGSRLFTDPPFNVVSRAFPRMTLSVVPSSRGCVISDVLTAFTAPSATELRHPLCKLICPVRASRRVVSVSPRSSFRSFTLPYFLYFNDPSPAAPKFANSTPPSSRSAGGLLVTSVFFLLPPICLRPLLRLGSVSLFVHAAVTSTCLFDEPFLCVLDCV